MTTGVADDHMEVLATAATTPVPAATTTTTTTTTEFWTVNTIHLTVATSLEDDTPLDINLMDTLGFAMNSIKNKKIGGSPKKKDSSSSDNNNNKNNNDEEDSSHDYVYWLPSHFSQNTTEFRSHELTPLFQQACQQAGFSIYNKGWEKTKHYSTFVCHRGRVRPGGKLLVVSDQPANPDDNDNDNNNNNNTEPEPEPEQDEPSSKRPSKRQRKLPSQQQLVPPTSEEELALARRSTKFYKKSKPPHRPIKNEETRCPFRFNVYWNSQHNRWFLPKQQRGTANHCGHHCSNPENVRLVSITTSAASGRSGTKQKHLTSGTRNGMEIDDDNDDHDNDDTENQNEAYHAMHSVFVQMSKCVKTKEELKAFQNGLDDLHGKLKTMKMHRILFGNAAASTTATITVNNNTAVSKTDNATTIDGANQPSTTNASNATNTNKKKDKETTDKNDKDKEDEKQNEETPPLSQPQKDNESTDGVTDVRTV